MVVKNHDVFMGRIRQKKSLTKLNKHKKSDTTAMKQKHLWNLEIDLGKGWNLTSSSWFSYVLNSG